MDFYNIHFIKSIKKIQDRPSPSLPEIALVGRSNVGKSSLLNVLFNRHNLAKTSSTPGKTRLINYFSLDEHIYIVDLPGYGYIKIIDDDSNDWQKMIETYLSKNDQLKMVLLLVDSRHEIMKIDLLMISWLDRYGINYTIVTTKKDKLSNNKFLKNYKQFKQKISNKTIIPFSSKTKEGKEEIMSLIKSHIV